MQNAQRFEPLTRHQPLLTSLRLTALRPSVWERVRAWARRTLTAETITEIALGIFTLSLLAWLFVGLQHALENYTIIPWP